MMEDVDTCIGHVIDCIDQSGLSKQTAVFFFSDNGGCPAYTTNRPLRSGKGRYYEGGIRVPLSCVGPVVCGPGTECNVPVISTDLLSDISGDCRSQRSHRQNTSSGRRELGTVAGRPDPHEDRPLFWHMPVYNVFGVKPCSVVRQGDYKLIQWFEDEHFELFNICNDIGEKYESCRSPARESCSLAS